MLLSDRDIAAQLDSGRVRLEPYDPTMVQPSSVDVRLDRYFRLFDNHKYPFIYTKNGKRYKAELSYVKAMFGTK